ncbi:MAG: hypothetical protein PHR87_14695 [Sulfurospirillaceae bacterium]|nr:hypothetical protein [Sulfurospirillaceae bacterium]
MSTLSKSERQGLNDIFRVLDTKSSFSERMIEGYKVFINSILLYFKVKKRF